MNFHIFFILFLKSIKLFTSQKLLACNFVTDIKIHSITYV